MWVEWEWPFCHCVLKAISAGGSCSVSAPVDYRSCSGIFWLPLTAPLPLTQFSAHSTPFSAPLMTFSVFGLKLSNVAEKLWLFLLVVDSNLLSMLALVKTSSFVPLLWWIIDYFVEGVAEVAFNTIYRWCFFLQPSRVDYRSIHFMATCTTPTEVLLCLPVRTGWSISAFNS